MARRSRRPGAAEAAAEPKAGACRLGVYARTSKSYGDDGCSIANQQRIVADHVGRLPDASVAGYYTDDGFTGTNQDRDAFQRMLADLREGRIDGVAAKDASRLGRDYIECQTLIRETLPALGARLVLVSDGVDTKDDAAADGMSMDLKSLLNDLYSRDLSRKIHATFDAARRRGPVILGNIPYGYMRDPDETHHLVPDPATAPFVREMFHMAVQGEANARIADWLNGQGAPTAGQTKCERAGKRATSKDSGRWLARNVNRVLANPVYAGDVVMGKWSQKLCAGEPHRKRPEDEWIVIEGAHEPLVSRESFDYLRRRREERAERRREAVAATERLRAQRPDRLAGKVFCGECGMPMHICRWVEDGVLWGAEYCCGNKDRGRGGGRHRIAAPLVETLCMDVIRAQLAAAADLEGMAARMTADGTLAARLLELDGGIARAEGEVSYLAAKCDQLNAEREELGMGEAERRRLSRALWGRHGQAVRELSELRAKCELVASLAERGAGAPDGPAPACDAFSAELAAALIERVTVHADGSLGIDLKVEDAFARRARVLEAIE